jgi:xanthine dehydrogenase/oxidase
MLLIIHRQAYVAQVCDVAANKVVSKVKRLGGGFGGKETRSIQLAGIVSLAAKKTGRPVRCMLNRDEDMITSGQRHPFLSRWKVAVNKDGKIQGLDLDMFCNGGWTQVSLNPQFSVVETNLFQGSLRRCSRSLIISL